MDETSKKAFATAAKTPADNIRDKDNAQLVPKPPTGAKHPPNLAPPGAVGIRRNLVPKSQTQSPKPEPQHNRDNGFDHDR
ncbi:hypothetical protein GG681_11010 [Epibacterium sp. SM1969]|uniref:Uncharacterized protein n=1 Tax=Tritonibacter aquimaris TaxID=2663379 RepID=A0A844ALU3_9RHOB|nr:hypothetical protein [Tritonibacter aquimaris]MQY43170.1 hypothetical protein [Tritonibacter aquimaris]